MLPGPMFCPLSGRFPSGLRAAPACPLDQVRQLSCWPRLLRMRMVGRRKVQMGHRRFPPFLAFLSLLLSLGGRVRAPVVVWASGVESGATLEPGTGQTPPRPPCNRGVCWPSGHQ